MARTRRIIIICFIILYFSYISCEPQIYSNEFAVYIPSGAADGVAAEHGFENLGQIGSLEGYYLFREHRIRKRSLSPSNHHSDKLSADPQVAWVEQQVELRRVKRDLVTSKDDPIPSIPPSSSSPSKRKSQFFPAGPFSENFGRFFFGPPFQSKSVRSQSRMFPDPLFGRQWYLSKGASDNFDMNVTGAWSQGYTGKGVVISILDDGIQHNHPDLAQNYDPAASTDINDNDSDPFPRDNGDNKHGTRCAGEVASVAFNDYCGVGVAYNASIGGVRMLDGTVNDAVEARAISLNPDHIDIYSASWGPEDDGKTVDGPGPLAKRAFINGVIRGRHGKGSIFIWASGNGGRHTDNCNCDGYTNSIFTLSISSASQRGLKPWYLEECSSSLATTYSSGTPRTDASVVTADMDGRLRSNHICTTDHTGTSASAPLAAGLCALALEANPDLTWRDMQHIVVRTSRYEPLSRESGWFVNAIGRHVNHKFGYGLMDGGAMVSLAKQWRSVPPQHICQTIISRVDRMIPTHGGSSIEVEINTDGCAGTTGEVRYLEHVQAKVSLRFLPRGHIDIKLTSPSDTVSTLLFQRPRDVFSEKFDDWPFLSVHFWGEKAAGTWKLRVTNIGNSNSANPGVLKEWQLILHGTKENPELWRFSDNDFDNSPSFTQFGDLIFSNSVLDHVTVPLNNLTRISTLPPSKSNSSISPPQDQSVSYGSKLCHSECIGGCSSPGPQNCRSCRHFSFQGECVRSCFEGTYASDNKECLPCHGSCAQCIGPRQNQCSSCPSPSLFVQHMGVCVEACPLGFYSEKGMCLSCGNQCTDCRTSEECLQCNHNLIVVNGSCRVSCPKGLYENDNFSCSRCHNDCETCISDDINGCASCFNSSFLSNGQCITNCPEGYYGDEEIGICLPCPMGCSNCDKGKSCFSCASGWRLKSNVCVADLLTCTSNEFTKDSKCSSCHNSCLNCKGPTSKDCLQCKSPDVLYDNSCQSSCPVNHFSSKGICHRCPYGCSNCTSLISCIKCSFKFYLYGEKCVASCPDNFYSDKGLCMKCDQSCALCWGPRRDQCLACSKKGALLYQGSCRSTCPEGHFNSNITCSPCYHNCKTCSDLGINSCTSCRDYLTLDGGMCLECSAGRYYDINLRSCSSCHNSCLTCNGKLHSNCTSCQAPYSLHPQTSTCRLCCNSKDAPEEEEELCCECNPDTNQCLGSGHADRRRIALSLRDKKKSTYDVTSMFSSAVWLLLLVCLINAIVFSLFAVFIQNKSKLRKQGRNGSYSYERIPLESSSEDNKSAISRSSLLPFPSQYRVVGSHFSNSDLESDSEDSDVYVKT